VNQTYDPFPYQTNYLFNGKEHDPVLPDDALFDFGPREYLADIGTWLVPDPTFNDGPNRYAFVRGDPINFADPTGNGSTPILALNLLVCTGCTAKMDGDDAHAAISQAFQSHPQNANAITGRQMGTVLTQLAPNAQVPGYIARLKPDVVLPGSPNQIWEIKRFGTGTAPGVLKAGGDVFYMNMFTPTGLGSMTHPGTYGLAAGDRGVYAYAAVLPGVINYQKIEGSQGWVIAYALADSAVKMRMTEQAADTILANPDVIAGGLVLGGGAIILTPWPDEAALATAGAAVLAAPVAP
jgi:RHS repeat-associated protein